MKERLRHWLDVQAETERQETQLQVVSEETDVLDLPAVSKRKWQKLNPQERNQTKLREHFRGGHYV